MPVRLGISDTTLSLLIEVDVTKILVYPLSNTLVRVSATTTFGRKTTISSRTTKTGRNESASESRDCCISFWLGVSWNSIPDRCPQRLASCNATNVESTCKSSYPRYKNIYLTFCFTVICVRAWSVKNFVYVSNMTFGEQNVTFARETNTFKIINFTTLIAKYNHGFELYHDIYVCLLFNLTK